MIPFHPFDSSPDAPPPRRWCVPVAGDERLALLVACRLRDDLPASGCRIIVEVQNRVVVLEGFVSAAEDRRRAHQIAWRTPGVFDVCNQLAAWEDERSS